MDSQMKIVPLTRKKLLQQALFKDSPTNLNLTQRKFTHFHSSSHQIENSQTTFCTRSSRVSPLREKDINQQEKLKTVQKPGFSSEKSSKIQEILIKLWKFNKIGGDIPMSFKSELQALQTSVKEDSFKMFSFLSELNLILAKQVLFPESLSPYLEEMICNIDLNYPLIHSGLSVAEAESVLFLSICRFSIKKIQVLRKILFPSAGLLTATSILLLCLGEVDLTLQKTLSSQKSRTWDLFIEYSQNSGHVVQNLRKIPECIRTTTFAIKTCTKIKTLFQKLETVSECPELQDLISEIISFFGIIEKIPSCKVGRLKRIEKIDSGSTSSRSKTPLTCRVSLVPKIRHIRSSSKDISLKKLSLNYDKRVQFLQESRFNKRIIEKLAENLETKMLNDPEYLVQIKKQDFSQYLEFKADYIEVHKDFWTQETIKELESSDLLRINLEENLKFADAKKEAFFSYVCNEQLLNNLVEEVKSRVLSGCKYE